MYAAQALRNAPVEVTLIDRRNFHLFQPLLYQVATGSLSPGEIAEPLRAILSDQKNTRVLMTEAVDLDADDRKLILADGELHYDTLLVAAGMQNHYFGHQEWERIAPGLKTIEDATAIRQKLLYAFEAAEKESDPEIRRSWLTFVIVGAGPTGVELAGALAEIARDTMRHDFRSIKPEEARILLLDGARHVLNSFTPATSEKAERTLIQLGVLPRTGVYVTSIDELGVTIETPTGEERIPTRTVVWAAGVKPEGFAKVLANRAGAELAQSGQVRVDPQLNVPGHPEIFVIGDMAYVEYNGQPLPGIAPAAIQEGQYVARSIVNRIRCRAVKPFHYFYKGSLAVIGRKAGVAEFGPLKFGGIFAWLTWLFVHLLFLVHFRNKLIVLIRWGIEYFTFDRGSRLITADARLQPAANMVETDKRT